MKTIRFMKATDPNGCTWPLKKKGRGGKTVTVLNFQNPGIDPVEWSKKLKARLGVGGSVDEASILLQGDVRTKLESYLQTEGFSVKRIGG
jgi:translation initiation factor 1